MGSYSRINTIIMKKITSFNDISLIIRFKCDVIDNKGHNMPFVKFLSMSLVDIVNNVLNEGTWTYDLD